MLWICPATSSLLERGTAASLHLPELTLAVPGTTVQGVAERVVSGSYDRRRSGRTIRPGLPEGLGTDPNPGSTFAAFHDERPGVAVRHPAGGRFGFPWLCAAPPTGPPLSA